jgi:hypothetical protein
MTTSPTLSKFLAEAKLQFRFLEEEFEFSEIPNDPNDNLFLIKYLNHPVQVRVEGVSWGAGLQVMLINLTRMDHEYSRIPLWVVARLRDADHDGGVSDQLQQLAVASKALRECANDILNGDFSIYPEAYKLMVEIHNQAETPRRKLP